MKVSEICVRGPLTLIGSDSHSAQMIDTRTLSPEEELVRGKPQDMVISALNFGKEVEENASVGRNAVTWWSRGRE